MPSAARSKNAPLAASVISLDGSPVWRRWGGHQRDALAGEQRERSLRRTREQHGLLDHERAISSSRASAVSQNSSRKSRTEANPWTRIA